MNFKNGSLSWSSLGGAKSGSDYIEFDYSGISAQDGAVISPAFCIPQNITVKTSADATSKKSGQYLSVSACSSSAGTIVFGNSKIEINKIGTFTSHGSKGYKDASETITLTSSKTALMYSGNAPVAYPIGLHKIKIQYN